MIRGFHGSGVMHGDKRRADYYFYVLLIVLSAALFILGSITVWCLLGWTYERSRTVTAGVLVPAAPPAVTVG